MSLSLAALLALSTFTTPTRELSLDQATPEVSRTYRVRQKVTLSEIPSGTADVRWWIAIPSDDRAQEVLDMEITSAPGPWSVQREAEHGNRFLFVQVASPTSTQLEVELEFTLRRRPIRVDIDAEHIGALTAGDRVYFASELRLDDPHMEVTPQVRAIADRVCGDTRNIAREALQLLEYVAGNADHYSKDPTKPKCGVGDALECLANGGGCCTDLHSLFIALARARGIPTRLQMGYRLLAKNEGKEVDPGYRCWPEYFVPGHGWVAADVVEADAASGAEGRAWFTGLSERRLWLNEGRNFVLGPQQSTPRVNTMVIGHAELDGRAARVLPDGERAAQLSRTIRFEELRPASTAEAAK
ncbi:MAG: transglutaminase domain-containing protein [Planctomycetes bacterium]|nr:transglutaminase domain-containing protein [Planctomycetota bacterium]